MAAKTVRSFGSKAKKEAREPFEIEVNGTKFKVQGGVSGITTLNLGASASSDDNSVSIKAILDYLADAMGEVEYKRFKKFANSPDTIVDTDTLTEIFGYVIEEHNASRPTPES